MDGNQKGFEGFIDLSVDTAIYRMTGSYYSKGCEE